MTKDKTLKDQAARQAPVPPPAYIREIIEQAKGERVLEPGEKRDQIMVEFAQSEAWTLLKKVIENKLRELAASLRNASDGNHSLDEVGYKYLVADQVNTFAAQLISFVENPLKVKKAQQETKDNTSKQD